MKIEEVTSETDLEKVLSDLAKYVQPEFRCDIGATTPHLPQIEYMQNFLISGWGYLGFSNRKYRAMGLLIPRYVDGKINDIQFFWLFGNPKDFKEFVTNTILTVRERTKPEKPEIWGIFSRQDFAELLYAEDLYSEVTDINHPALFGKTDFSGYTIRFEG